MIIVGLIALALAIISNILLVILLILDKIGFDVVTSIMMILLAIIYFAGFILAIIFIIMRIFC